MLDFLSSGSDRGDQNEGDIANDGGADIDRCDQYKGICEKESGLAYGDLNYEWD